MIKFIIKRLGEASSGAALSSIFATLGGVIYAGVPISAALPVVGAALWGIFRPEAGAK